MKMNIEQKILSELKKPDFMFKNIESGLLLHNTRIVAITSSTKETRVLVEPLTFAAQELAPMVSEVRVIPPQ